MGAVLLERAADRVARELDVERLARRELEMGRVRRYLDLAYLFPEVVGGKQTFEQQEAKGILAARTAVTGGTAEVNIIIPLDTPIAGGYVDPQTKYLLDAWGTAIYPVTTPGTTAFTLRVGTSATPASNTIAGAASAAVQGTTQTGGVPFYVRGALTVRSATNIAGANTILYGRCVWFCPLALQAAGSAGGVIFGGVTAGVDTTIAQAFVVSATPSVAGQSFQVEDVSWFSRN